jgi:hypothetical protein
MAALPNTRRAKFLAALLGPAMAAQGFPNFSKGIPNFSKDFQAFSKEIPSFCKTFPWRKPAKSGP